MGTTELGPATVDDLDTVTALQERASVAALAHVFPPERYPFPRAWVRARWTTALREETVTLAVTGEDAVGVVATHDGWLNGLYVDPGWWGSGVAALLHDRAVEQLKTGGSASARLWVLEGNARARSFYERRGWVTDGTTRVVPVPPHPIDLGYALSL